MLDAFELWRVPAGEETTSATLDRAAGPGRIATVVLGHGASTNREHRTMQNLAGALNKAGLDVVRFNFLYAEQKRNPPDRMPRLMECFRAVVAKVRNETQPERLIIGGHSMGGRAASHLAADGFECNGVLLLSYPLHPAGSPEKLRSEHLPRISIPILCVNGTRDDLCTRELMESTLAVLGANWQMHWLEGADHSYHVQKRSGRTEDEVFGEIGRVAGIWASELP